MALAANAETDAQTLTIVREFDAPRELVFSAWTDPARVVRWFGPHEAPAVSFDGEARVGGSYRGCLKNRQTGESYWHTGTYRELVEPERIVMTFRWDEADALDTIITLTFEDTGGKTRMTFHQAPFSDAGSRESHAEGWSEAFERLETFIGGAA
ncbi:SRPBCC family protein [Pelagibacterium xiamenense]|uniref:SRPBCC family protein n=1 Tax=Pelagibacterium xiamenense TaxID=2901140 RepID=UPI001E3F7046|nr:SRPBCC domain-containing protein [Pelagibacterium xiamenense]MCD7059532.1 SRPBCC domain-containing protein [Pelagibacterium xiamenense]